MPGDISLLVSPWVFQQTLLFFFLPDEMALLDFETNFILFIYFF